MTKIYQDDSFLFCYKPIQAVRTSFYWVCKQRQTQIFGSAPKRTVFTIVSSDTDFLDLSLLKGAPPKLIHLRMPNPDRSATLNVLLAQHAFIQQILIDECKNFVEVVLM